MVPRVRHVDHKVLGSAPSDDELCRLVPVQVLFDVDRVGWDVDKVAGGRVDGLAEPLSEVHSDAAPKHVDARLGSAVVARRRSPSTAPCSRRFPGRSPPRGPCWAFAPYRWSCREV